MDKIIYYICIPFGYLLKFCYMIVPDYGVAIILFTLLTKLVLMPLSIWIQKNSILMVKMQPEINFMRAGHQGNLDVIAEKQAKIYKREHYHPMLSLIPLILQIVILLGVVQAIYHPLSYMFAVSDGSIANFAGLISADAGDNSIQLQIIDAIKSGQIVADAPTAATMGMSVEALGGLLSRIASFDAIFLGLNLSIVPSVAWGWYIMVPIVAGASSWAMCFTQNLSNVIQHEQGKLNKYGIMTLSVGLSLYLGLFVPSGIALYWTASNLFSIAVMYLLNACINPKKYVDYRALEESRIALAAAKAYGKVDKKDPQYKLAKKKEKIDYRAFKKVANKHLVFYSEKSGFYKYFKDVIEEILKRSNATIHYVTNDYNDQIFEIAKTEPRIKPYYISLKKSVLLFMLIETDIFVMSTPYLNKYYLKRSMIKSDVEYVYIPHDTMSVHYGFKETALEAFDTVFCVGPHQKNELEKIIEIYKQKPKTLVEFGYPLAEKLIEDGKKALETKVDTGKKEILIAPSWQEDNLLDSCIDDLINGLACEDYHIIVRPHPEYIKRFGYQLNKLVEKYKGFDETKLTFELDFSKNKSVYSSDLLITDWSGIATEFCFATQKPAIFVNTKPKCDNPNWEKIGLEPVEVSLRNKIGVAVEKSELPNIRKVAQELFNKQDEYKQKIQEIYKDFLYNHGTSAEVGAKYLLKSLVEKAKSKKK